MDKTTAFLEFSAEIKDALPSLDIDDDILESTRHGNGAYGQTIQMMSKLIEYKFVKDCKNITAVKKGSAGSVFLINNTDLNERNCAIKIIPLDHKDEEKQQQYRRELNIMKHKLLYRDFIVSYITHYPDCIDKADYLFIKMELCWRSLDTIITDHRKVIKTRNPPPRFYQVVFPQILKGLSAIHSIGWVHRDVHPGNILIVRPFKEIRDVHVKIADFGNAKEIKSIIEASGEETVSAGPTFTLPYDAPEINSSGRRYDYKIDLFLAGHVLCRISGFNPEAFSKPFIHQDDNILEDLIERLTKHQPNERPNAEEALELAWEERKFHVEAPDVMINIRSCETRDNTMYSLKAAINTGTNIPLESQLLQQKKITTGGQEELTDITSDDDVKRMFENEKNVSIVVSLKPACDLNKRDFSNPEV